MSVALVPVKALFQLEAQKHLATSATGSTRTVAKVVNFIAG
jgi:hypothetical protein